MSCARGYRRLIRYTALFESDTTILEHPPKPPQQLDDEDFRRVSDGYFEAMGIPLL